MKMTRRDYIKANAVLTAAAAAGVAFVVVSTVIYAVSVLFFKLSMISNIIFGQEACMYFLWMEWINGLGFPMEEVDFTLTRIQF